MSKKEIRAVGRKIFDKMKEKLVNEGIEQGKSIQEIAESINQLRRNLYDKTF